jgi:hypothetical protein
MTEERYSVMPTQRKLIPGGHESEHYQELANRYGYLQILFSHGYLLKSEGAKQPVFDIRADGEESGQGVRVYLSDLTYRFIQTESGFVTNQRYRMLVPRATIYRPSVRAGSLPEELQRLVNFFGEIANAESGVEKDVHEMFRGLLTNKPQFVTPDLRVQTRTTEKGVGVHTQPDLSVPLSSLGFAGEDKKVVGLFFEPTIEFKGNHSSRSHGKIFPLVI